MQPKTGAKQATKTHRRSRTGCFTCRLRRKKCDEGKPSCKACRHLGLTCDYKRPVWWSSAEHRKTQKEQIKMMIKRTKLTEKAVHLSAPGNNALHRAARSLSEESGFSLEHDAMGVVGEGYPHHPHDPVFMPGHPDQYHQHYDQIPPQYSHPNYDFDPYQPKTHIGMMPVMSRRPSSASSFSSIQRRDSIMTTASTATLTDHHIPRGITSDESEYGYFDFNEFPAVKREVGGQPLVQIQTQQLSPEASPLHYIPVEDGDERLLHHFLDNVLTLILPILSAHGNFTKDAILPALADNECFRHCCLSISALHLKTTQNMTGILAEYCDQDITRHRYATIQGVCDALSKDQDHLQILEATLGMILFQTAVGTIDDSLPDIPWHQHLQAVSSLVQKLDLTHYLHPIASPETLTASLNMTLTAWIDILGATMRGHAPIFADTYREKHLSQSLSGLRELMGCDDRVMYLISEIACLENLRDTNTITEVELCDHVSSLAYQIDRTEPPPDLILPPIYQSGNLDPRALTSTISAAFRLAARAYLCSLVPGFHHDGPQIRGLIEKVTMVLETVSPEFAPALTWVYLIAGSVAGLDSGFRRHWEKRVAEMGEKARFGAFGRMKAVLEEVWMGMENGVTLRWREVMRSRGWEDLLI